MLRSNIYRLVLLCVLLCVLLSAWLLPQPVSGFQAVAAGTAVTVDDSLWTRWHPGQFALAEDDQFLWIGAGGGVVRWDKNSQSYRRYSRLDGLPQQNIYALAVDGAGNRWFGGDGGLSRLDAANGWSHFTTANSGLYNNLIDGIALAGDNTLWVSHGLPDGVVSRRAPDGSWRWYPTLTTAVALDYTQILTTQQPNPLWTVAGSEVWTGYWVYNGNQWSDRTPPYGSAHPTALVVGNSQQVWALDGSVRAWDGNTWSDVSNGHTYTTLAVGPDGTLWGGGIHYTIPFGFETAALGQVLQPDTFHSLGKSSPVTALWPTAAGVWAVGPGWLLQPDGIIFEFPDVPAYAVVTDALVSPQGQLWLHSQRSTVCTVGVFQTLDDRGDAVLDNDGWTTDRSLGRLTALEQAPGGDLWAGWEEFCRFPFYGGPQRYHQGEWLSAGFPYASDFYGPHISDIFAQDDRHLWFAYERATATYERASGVAALNDGGTPTDHSDDQWHDYPIEPAGADGAVVVDGLGRLWLGNSNGLYRYTGSTWVLVSKQYPVDHGVCDLVATPDGTIYAQGAGYTTQTGSYSCPVGNPNLLRVAPDGSMTTEYINQLVQEDFAQIQATEQRNRLWSVAPDGAVWYPLPAYVAMTGAGSDLLQRVGSDGSSNYPLPMQSNLVRSLSVDAHNHVWLVADAALWRLTPKPTFQLTVQPRIWWLTPNTSRHGTVVVDRQEGFNTPITLTFASLPTGISATLTPPVVTAGQPTTLTLTTTDAVAPGVYPLTLVGTSETLTQTAPLTIMVVSELFNLYLPAVNR